MAPSNDGQSGVPSTLPSCETSLCTPQQQNNNPPSSVVSLPSSLDTSHSNTSATQAAVSSTTTVVSVNHTNSSNSNLPTPSIPSPTNGAAPIAGVLLPPDPPGTITPNLSSARPSAIPEKPVILFEWSWELFTWLLGTVAMVLILGLLVAFQDKPLRAWKSEVQISAVTAILSQLAQSALIVSVASCLGQAKWSFLQGKQHSIEVERFDEAFRGPEGSLKLLIQSLFHFKSREYTHFHFFVAFFASLATLLMLSFGAFTQQSVTLGIREIENSTQVLASLATASRALNFEGLDFNSLVQFDLELPLRGPQFDNSLKAFQGLSESYLLSSALLSGTATNNTLSSVTAQCPTANCNWTSYTTLAVCPSVEDISSQLKTMPSTEEHNTSIVYNFTYPTNRLSARLYSERWLNISLPVENIHSPVDGNPDFPGSLHFWVASQSGIRDEPLTVGALGEMNTIADIYIIYFPPCEATNNTAAIPETTNWYKAQEDISKWKALRGTLSLCMQTLTTSVTNGSTHTSVIGRADNATKWRINMTARWTDTRRSGLVYYPEGEFPYQGRVPYSMEVSSMQALGREIQDTFNQA